MQSAAIAGRAVREQDSHSLAVAIQITGAVTGAPCRVPAHSACRTGSAQLRAPARREGCNGASAAPAARFGAKPAPGRLGRRGRRAQRRRRSAGRKQVPRRRKGEEPVRVRLCACSRFPGPMALAPRISPASRRPPAQPGLTICKCDKSQSRNRRAAEVSTPPGPCGHTTEDGGFFLVSGLKLPSRGNPPPTPAATAWAGRPDPNVCAGPQGGAAAVLCCCTRDQAVRILLLTCGAKGTRTPDPLLAKQVLFQLSYSPARWRYKVTRSAAASSVRRQAARTARGSPAQARAPALPRTGMQSQAKMQP
jgi:hypothetical protein